MKRYKEKQEKSKRLYAGIDLHILPDAAALAVNLEAGALDMAFDFSPRDAARLMNERKATLLQSMGGASVTDIMMNVSRAPFDNQKVRQAINHAVDRKRFVDTVLVGFGDPWCQPFPAQSLGFSRGLGAKSCTFDLTQAKRLLAEAGYPNGF